MPKFLSKGLNVSEEPSYTGLLLQNQKRKGRFYAKRWNSHGGVRFYPSPVRDRRDKGRLGSVHSGTLTLHCTWSPLPGLCSGHSLHSLSAYLDPSSTIKFTSKKTFPMEPYQENPINSDPILLSGSDSSPKVPEYWSKILGSISNLFSLQCITQCQMHNRLSISICRKWKGGEGERK